MSEDRNYYSCPHRFIGLSVEIQYNQDMVEIFYRQERIAFHKRSYKPGKYITVGDHMPSSHRHYNDWNPEYFGKRASKIGPNTRDYIDKLISQYDYPEVGYKQAQGILGFVKSYGPERLENACKRALGFEKSTYHTIEKILRNRMDIADLFSAENHVTPEHKNIRGSYN
jgi:transposase